MRPASFAETILQHVVGSFEEQHDDVQARRTQRIELFFKVGEKLTFANVDDEGGAGDAFLVVVVGNEAAEGRQHHDGQVVDAEISQVLKSVGGRRHPRPAKAGDDDDIRNAGFDL